MQRRMSEKGVLCTVRLVVTELEAERSVEKDDEAGLVTIQQQL